MEGGAPHRKKLLIPRCYMPKGHDAGHFQLHSFCDASKDAYAGVVYLRSTNQNDVIHTSLVIAKTKVAPIKRFSITRLEFCGAVLAMKLLQYASKILGIDDLYAWPASTVVLAWLQGNPRRFKPFVGNRVSEILSLLPTNVWRHVTSNDNPADPASRGLSPARLLKSHIWWKGPEWLRESEQSWPSTPPIETTLEPAEEKIMSVVLMSLVDISFLDKVSNYYHLKRITAWMLRLTQLPSPT